MRRDALDGLLEGEGRAGVPAGAPRRGFTIAEMTVVLSIIAILAAILFPVFAQAREAARRAQCESNLLQVGMALRMYARDHDGRLPPREHDLLPLVRPYLNDLGVFRCASDSQGAYVGSEKLGARRTQPMQISPTVPILWPVNPAVHPGLITLGPGRLYTSYQYRAGLTLDERGDTPLAGDWSFLHRDTANVVYLAGYVRPMRRDQWKPFSRGPRPLPSGAESPRGVDTTPLLK